ncbi:MAG TPA: anti-sigma factor [Gaiellaceae bacterium]|jgi:anti-sigma-K factor RskA|nr:anti-sigma factor [Gaiellaceae bacterium]
MALLRTNRRRDDVPDDQPVELAALADGSIAPGRRAQLEARVESSPELAELLGEQELALALVRAAGAEVEAPAGLRARVEAERRPRRTSRFVLVGVATAAVAAAAIVAALVLSSGTSSQRFTAALGPTGLAPQASGEATLTKTTSGWRIRLDASGLPRRDRGRFYEAWLKSPTGVLVPIGTFNEGRNVTLWAGVSPKQFTTLTVTREQADGDQASSGQKVLVGPVVP